MSMLEKARTYVGMYGDNDIRGRLKADHETIREAFRNAKRAGIDASVKSPGSAEPISSHVSGAETRASGVGRTEYAPATVRSLAFWL